MHFYSLTVGPAFRESVSTLMWASSHGHQTGLEFISPRIAALYVTSTNRFICELQTMDAVKIVCPTRMYR
jgi:hypothetical protein